MTHTRRLAHYFPPIAAACLLLFSELSQAKETELFPENGTHPIALGVGIGRGNTDWQFLTSDNAMVQFSAPDSAQDRGTAYLLFAEYTFSPHFFIGAEYEKLANSTVHFADGNDYDPNFAPFSLHSRTDVIGTYLGFRLTLGHTPAFAFSSIGAQQTHRRDALADKTHWGGLFGGGLGYTVSHLIDASAGFNYTTGYGETETLPAIDYIPFTYTFYVAAKVRL